MHSKKTKIVVITLIAFFIAVGLLVTFHPKRAIKIGYVGALSGSSSDLGNKTLKGVKLAVEELNASGGLLNRKLELIIRDSAIEGTNPEKVIQELKAQGVRFIVGLELSSIATEYLPFLDKYGLLGVTPGSSSYTLDGLDDHLLRVNLSDNIMMRVFADYASEQLKIKNVDVIHSTNNLKYAESIKNVFSKYFVSAGGEVSEAISFNSTSETNFKELVQPLVQTDSDAILIIGNDFDTSMIIQQLKLQGVDTYYFVSAWAKTHELIDFIGIDTSKIRIVSIENPEPSGVSYDHFVQLYKESFNSDVDAGSCFGYDALKVIAKGISNAQSIEVEKVKDNVLKQSDFVSVYGDTFSIDAYGDVDREVWIVRIDDGKYKKVDNYEK